MCVHTCTRIYTLISQYDAYVLEYIMRSQTEMALPSFESMKKLLRAAYMLIILEDKTIAEIANSHHPSRGKCTWMKA